MARRRRTNRRRTHRKRRTHRRRTYRQRGGAGILGANIPYAAGTPWSVNGGNYYTSNAGSIATYNFAEPSNTQRGGNLLGDALTYLKYGTNTVMASATGGQQPTNPSVLK